MSIFSKINATIRWLLILLLVISSAFIFILTQFNKKISYKQFQTTLYLISKLMRIQVKIYGEPIKDRPLLITSNHISYIDIISMGAHMNVSFIGKAEIKTWPLIGWMGKLSQVIFMDRRPAQAQKMIELIKNEISHSQKPLLLYPEGTTSNGTYIKEFKSALFNFIEPQLKNSNSNLPKISIQPITIIYRGKNGSHLSENEIYKFAWFDNNKIDKGPKNKTNPSLLKHMFYVLTNGGFIIEIHYLNQLDLSKIHDRKDLANSLHKVIETKFEKLK